MVVNQNLGLSPLYWMNRLRQVRGLALLNQGMSVKETAYELGYRQTSHFSREFKRFHGVPPSSFRHGFYNEMRILDI